MAGGKPPNAGVAAPDAKGIRRLLLLAAAACAVFPLGWLVRFVLAPEPLHPDFFGLWSFGHYVLTHAPATIYDGQELRNFQAGLGMEAEANYPFHYPPWILLLLAPLGALPFQVAFIAWMTLTFAAYVWALSAWRWHWPAALLLLAAPSTAVCAIVGQNGFATAATLIGGLRLLRPRPFLAGAVLALTALKPQLAILVPFVLLFGRHWRAMAGTGLCIGLLTLASAAAFGTGIWEAWVAYMRGNAGALSEGHHELLDMMPTVTSAVLLLGGSAAASHAVQAAAGVAALLAVWRVRSCDGPEAWAAVCLAAILTTPFAFHYDLAAVTGASLAVVAARLAHGGRFASMELPLLLACVVLPIVLPARPGPWSAAVPGAFALGLWLMCRVAASQTPFQATPSLEPWPENGMAGQQPRRKA